MNRRCLRIGTKARNVPQTLPCIRRCFSSDSLIRRLTAKSRMPITSNVTKMPCQSVKVQQESAEYRREDRAQSVDDHQHREKSGAVPCLVQIGRDRFRQYDPACSGDSLEQSEQDERIDVPGEQAGDGRRDEQAERDEDRPFAAVLVADRADQQLASRRGRAYLTSGSVAPSMRARRSSRRSTGVPAGKNP